MKLSRNRAKEQQAGFSLIELLIAIIVLMIVMGAVFSQIDQIQKKTKVESVKLDLTQESRDFMDQFARDLHMSGYPKARIYQNAPLWNSGDPAVTSYALGLVKATPTELRFEGDITGDGTVYSVSYKYFANDANDPNCPCLRRSVDKKTNTTDPVNGYNPVYYTEIQNVIDPTGMAQGVFTYWEATGASVNVGTGIDIVNNQPNIQQIDAIKVNLNTRSLQFDPHTGQRTIVNSMATIAQLEN
jgi:prepilin-type N-terminal cleavage/methylation domain-containing protein